MQAPSRSKHHDRLAWAGLAIFAGAIPAQAVEVTDLKGLEDIYGRYAPAGDCKRQPRIVVDVTAWYWHFMALVWLYIFGLLEFVR